MIPPRQFPRIHCKSKSFSDETQNSGGSNALQRVTLFRRGRQVTSEAESERRANGENRGMRATHGRLRLALTQPTDLYIPPSTNCSFLTWFDFRLVSRFGVNILLDFLFSVTGLVSFVFKNGLPPT